jgi:hypothetical protein
MKFAIMQLMILAILITCGCTKYQCNDGTIVNSANKCTITEPVIKYQCADGSLKGNISACNITMNKTESIAKSFNITLVSAGFTGNSYVVRLNVLNLESVNNDFVFGNIALVSDDHKQWDYEKWVRSDTLLPLTAKQYDLPMSVSEEFKNGTFSFEIGPWNNDKGTETLHWTVQG